MINNSNKIIFIKSNQIYKNIKIKSHLISVKNYYLMVIYFVIHIQIFIGLLELIDYSNTRPHIIPWS